MGIRATSPRFDVREIMPNVFQWVVGIVVLVVGVGSFAVFLRSWVGLGLKLRELLFGEHDYSGYLIMSAAEGPATVLLLHLVLSVIVFALLILAMMFLERKGLI